MASDTTDRKGWLSGYRVLDLSDHRGTMAGMLFARLGADVVQVEPPAGSRARRTPPFHGDASLFWEAFGAGKRSIVCESLAQLEQLAAAADIVIEMKNVGIVVSKVLVEHRGRLIEFPDSIVEESPATS